MRSDSVAGDLLDQGQDHQQRHVRCALSPRNSDSRHQLFSCPVQPGKVNESISMTVPEELPAGSYKTILEVNSSKGDYIGHFEVRVPVTSWSSSRSRRFSSRSRTTTTSPTLLSRPSCASASPSASPPARRLPARTEDERTELGSFDRMLYSFDVYTS